MPDVGEMKRWAAWIVVGVLALTLGAVLVIQPWSEPEIPRAPTYSSVSDLAHDLNGHGVGCAQPSRPRRFKLIDRYLAIFIDRQLLPQMLVCSVDGQPVVLGVIPPTALKVWLSPEPTTGFQNALPDANAGLENMLVGPNWMVIARSERDPIPALSAIRAEIGGTLVMDASPTAPASAPSPTPNGSSA